MAKKRVVFDGEAEVTSVRKKNEETTEDSVTETVPDGATEEAEPVENIRDYTVEELRRGYRKICAALRAKAEEGKLAELKMMLYIIERFGDEQTAKQQGGKTLSEMLLDELKRRQDAREAAIDLGKKEEQNTKSNEADGEGMKSGVDAELG